MGWVWVFSEIAHLTMNTDFTNMTCVYLPIIYYVQSLSFLSLTTKKRKGLQAHSLQQ